MRPESLELCGTYTIATHQSYIHMKLISREERAACVKPILYVKLKRAPQSNGAAT